MESMVGEELSFCMVGATIPAVGAWLGPQRGQMQAEPSDNPKNKSNL